MPLFFLLSYVSAAKQNRLKLDTLYGCVHCLRNAGEISDQRRRLFNRIILPKGDKIKVFSCKKASDVFCRTGKPIVGRYRNQNRTGVS